MTEYDIVFKSHKNTHSVPKYQKIPEMNLFIKNFEFRSSPLIITSLIMQTSCCGQKFPLNCDIG